MTTAAHRIETKVPSNGTIVLEGLPFVAGQDVEIIILNRAPVFEDDDWDRQMKADAKAGRFDKILAEVDKEYDPGLSTPRR